VRNADELPPVCTVSRRPESIASAGLPPFAHVKRRRSASAPKSGQPQPRTRRVAALSDAGIIQSFAESRGSTLNRAGVRRIARGSIADVRAGVRRIARVYVESRGCTPNRAGLRRSARVYVEARADASAGLRRAVDFSHRFRFPLDRILNVRGVTTSSHRAMGPWLKSRDASERFGADPIVEVE
jgi:hypothetical protein